MFCGNCGTKNEVTAKHCVNCGNALAPANESVSNVAPAAVPVNNSSNDFVVNAKAKGNELITKGKDFYAKSPNTVYGIVGGVVLVIILFIVLGDKTMTCETSESFADTSVDVKYNGDDDVTKIFIKVVYDTTDGDFEDYLDYEDVDIDEFVDDQQDDLEDYMDDAPDGYKASIKKSGDNIIQTQEFKGEALEEYLDDLDVKDVDDLEDYLEDGYSDYKCEK